MKKNIGQKLAGEALDKVWRDVYNQEKDLEKRKVIKGARWLLLRHDKDIYRRLQNGNSGLLQM